MRLDKQQFGCAVVAACLVFGVLLVIGIAWAALLNQHEDKIVLSGFGWLTTGTLIAGVKAFFQGV